MKVLVMGGSYFIGKKIVHMLLDKGYQVTTLNRGSRPPADDRVHTILCDRHDPDQMKIQLKGKRFDYVVDLGLNAGEVELLLSSLDTEDLKQFIFISSSAVYDLDQLTVPFKEDDRLAENSVWTFYGLRKIEAEAYLKTYFSGTDTGVVAIRPPYVYGEDNYAQRESFIFDHILEGRPLLLPNDGSTRVQFIYTSDLGSNILALMDQDLKGFNAFNVGNEEGITFKEWAQACARVAGRPLRLIEHTFQGQAREVRSFFPLYTYDNILDVKKIKAIDPKETPFEEGLEAAFDWFVANRDQITFKEEVKDHIDSLLKGYGVCHDQ